jgi:hypothetical protein
MTGEGTAAKALLGRRSVPRRRSTAMDKREMFIRYEIKKTLLIFTIHYLINRGSLAKILSPKQ